MFLLELGCHWPCMRCVGDEGLSTFQSGLFGCRKWGSTWVSPGRGGLQGGCRRGPGSVPLLCSLSLQARCSGLQSHSFSLQIPWHSCVLDFAPRAGPAVASPPCGHIPPCLSVQVLGMEFNQPGFSGKQSPRQKLPWRWEVWPQEAGVRTGREAGERQVGVCAELAPASGQLAVWTADHP